MHLGTGGAKHMRHHDEHIASKKALDRRALKRAKKEKKAASRAANSCWPMFLTPTFWHQAVGWLWSHISSLALAGLQAGHIHCVSAVAKAKPSVRLFTTATSSIASKLWSVALSCGITVATWLSSHISALALAGNQAGHMLCVSAVSKAKKCAAYVASTCKAAIQATVQAACKLWELGLHYKQNTASKPHVIRVHEDGRLIDLMTWHSCVYQLECFIAKTIRFWKKKFTAPTSESISVANIDVVACVTHRVTIIQPHAAATAHALNPKVKLSVGSSMARPRAIHELALTIFTARAYATSLDRMLFFVRVHADASDVVSGPDCIPLTINLLTGVASPDFISSTIDLYVDVIGRDLMSSVPTMRPNASANESSHSSEEEGLSSAPTNTLGGNSSNSMGSMDSSVTDSSDSIPDGPSSLGDSWSGPSFTQTSMMYGSFGRNVCAVVAVCCPGEKVIHGMGAGAEAEGEGSWAQETNNGAGAAAEGDHWRDDDAHSDVDGWFLKDHDYLGSEGKGSSIDQDPIQGQDGAGHVDAYAEAGAELDGGMALGGPEAGIMGGRDGSGPAANMALGGLMQEDGDMGEFVEYVGWNGQEDGARDAWGGLRAKVALAEFVPPVAWAEFMGDVAPEACGEEGNAAAAPPDSMALPDTWAFFADMAGGDPIDDVPLGGLSDDEDDDAGAADGNMAMGDLEGGAGDDGDVGAEPSNLVMDMVWANGPWVGGDDEPLGGSSDGDTNGNTRTGLSEDMVMDGWEGEMGGMGAYAGAGGMGFAAPMVLPTSLFPFDSESLAKTIKFLYPWAQEATSSAVTDQAVQRATTEVKSQYRTCGFVFHTLMVHEVPIFNTAQVTVGKVIGGGGNAQVYEASRNGSKWAAKVFAVGELVKSLHFMTSFIKELFLLAKLKGNENVVQIQGILPISSFQFAILMDRHDGDLNSWPMGPRTVYTILRLLRGPAHALSAMHELGYVHTDVKLGNMLRNDKTCTGSVGDLGDFDHYMDGGVAFPYTGTTYYCSPHRYRGGCATSKCDVWGMGVCLLEALTDQDPYSPVLYKDINTMYQAKQGNPNVPAPDFKLSERLDVRVRNLIRSCLALKPEDRPSMRVVAETLDALLL